MNEDKSGICTQFDEFEAIAMIIKPLGKAKKVFVIVNRILLNNKKCSLGCKRGVVDIL